jgi:hypothetical protein
MYDRPQTGDDPPLNIDLADLAGGWGAGGRIDVRGESLGNVQLSSGTARSAFFS